MKKLLIIIGSVLIMAFVVIVFVNAAGSKKEDGIVKTEACDPATCTGHKEGAQMEVPGCGQTTSPTGACCSKTTENN